MGNVRPHLWFAKDAEKAAEFYARVIPNSSVKRVVNAPAGMPDVEEGQPFVVDFVVDGLEVTAINAGPVFTLDEAFSFLLECESQQEVDHYWSTLTADGGEESMCGWLRDKFGVSWQVVPKQLEEIFGDYSTEGSRRAVAAMMTMKKLDIAALEAARDGI